MEGGGGEDKSLKRTALTAPRQQAAWGSGVTRARGPPSLRRRCLPSAGRRFRSTTCAPDRWLVIDRKVYNITKWSSRHPGGQRVIGHYAGEDATVRAWGLSRHPSPLQEGGRSRGSQGVRQDLQRRMELGGPSRREGKVSTALTSRSESSFRGAVGSACRGGRILEPGRQIRAVEIRAGSIARAWTLASVPSSGFIRSPRPPKRGAGTLGLWRPQRGRWPPLDPAERSGRGARCRTRRASPILRPDKGAGKES